MISADFAPNESREDALLAIQLLFQPWKWRRGKETNNLKRRLKSRFFSPDTQISLFLSARGALYQYIKVLSLPPETEVLLSGFSPIMTVLPLMEQQLKPIYVDINSDDLSMSFTDLEHKYSQKAKLLILQHPYGATPKDRKRILSFAKEKKLTVIEDISQGFDTDLYRKKRFATALLCSFSRISAISSVLGGAIILNGKKNADLMRDVEKNIPNTSYWLILRMILYKIGSAVVKSTYTIYLGQLFQFLMMQFNLVPALITKKEQKGHFDTLYLKIYPNICSLFLMRQLDRFNDVQLKRKRSAALYKKKIDGFGPASDLALMYYPVFIHHSLQAVQSLKKDNIMLSTEYYTVQNEQINHHMFGYTLKSCPTCENIVPHIVKLPTTVSKKESQKLITRVKKVLSPQNESVT